MRRAPLLYTAPIKALVSGSSSIRPASWGENGSGWPPESRCQSEAPVICATAEVLGQLALREGAGAPVDQVVMDEFHFYGDPDRGWAWQVPLLELDERSSSSCRPPSAIPALRDRSTQAQRPALAVIRSATRPVPLDYSYAHIPIHETIETLLGRRQGPIYAVHFTHEKDAVARAQRLPAPRGQPQRTGSHR